MLDSLNISPLSPTRHPITYADMVETVKTGTNNNNAIIGVLINGFLIFHDSQINKTKRTKSDIAHDTTTLKVLFSFFILLLLRPATATDSIPKNIRVP